MILHMFLLFELVKGVGFANSFVSVRTAKTIEVFWKVAQTLLARRLKGRSYSIALATAKIFHGPVR